MTAGWLQAPNEIQPWERSRMMHGVRNCQEREANRNAVESGFCLISDPVRYSCHRLHKWGIHSGRRQGRWQRTPWTGVSWEGQSGWQHSRMWAESMYMFAVCKNIRRLKKQGAEELFQLNGSISIRNKLMYTDNHYF